MVGQFGTFDLRCGVSFACVRRLWICERLFPGNLAQRWPAGLSGSFARSLLDRPHRACRDRHPVRLARFHAFLVTRITVRSEKKLSHVPVELGVPGPIHFAHSAFADLGGDRVMAEPCADVQGHECVARSRSFYRQAGAGSTCVHRIASQMRTYAFSGPSGHGTASSRPGCLKGRVRRTFALAVERCAVGQI